MNSLLPEFTVISRTPYALVNEKKELVQSTFVVYRDEENQVGTIVVAGAKPSDSDIKKAIEARKKAPKAA